jgi:hypothetical protein
MQVHSYGGLYSLFDPRTLFDCVVFDLDWKELAVHLNNRAFPIIIGEGSSI